MGVQERKAEGKEAGGGGGAGRGGREALCFLLESLALKPSWAVWQPGALSADSGERSSAKTGRSKRPSSGVVGKMESPAQQPSLVNRVLGFGHGCT